MCLGSLSTGAADDLRRATELARAMIAEYGMSETIGPVSLRNAQRPLLLRDPNELSPPRAYSEHTARQVDREVKRTIDRAEQRARAQLEARRDLLHALAARLIEQEVVGREELEQLAREAKAGGDETSGDSGVAQLPA
jgi:cell division protease FtsH